MSPRHHRELKTWTFKGITQEASLGGGGEKGGPRGRWIVRSIKGGEGGAMDERPKL